MKLPRIITTSVVRSAQHGESHGGLYLVDLGSGEVEQVLDWNDPAISWEGRGGDRGLRGIALHGERVCIAASDEIFVYDRKFNLLETHRNRYLKHCHEIAISGDTLYLTATDANSVLELDLASGCFTHGHCVVRNQRPKRSFLQRTRRESFGVCGFEPNEACAQVPSGGAYDLHINNVSVCDGAILVSGTQIPALLCLEKGTVRELASLPLGTHNATVYRGGVIYNDTRNDGVVVAPKHSEEVTFRVPYYDDLPLASISSDHARQGFARGLCTWGELVIAGSSPSTISVYDVSSRQVVQRIRISKDIRNCIHGLEIWAEKAEASDGLARA